MNRVDDPLQLPLALPAEPKQIDLATIQRQPSMTAAIALCVSLGGFDNDKDFCRRFGLDPGTWARIKSGDAHFPHDRLGELFSVCGNDVPLCSSLVVYAARWRTSKRSWKPPAAAISVLGRQPSPA